MNKDMKAGYQGKPDAMREKAERLLNHPGHAADVYNSKSCADKEGIRPYKKGGSVKKCQKFAMGGVAKIRHDEATSDGMPTKPKKKPIKYIL